MKQNTDQILVRIERDPLKGFTVDEFIAFLQKSLKNRVSKAYLFGSLARNELNRHSDIDLILVVEPETEIAATDFLDRPSFFDDLYDRVAALDLLVYTTEEFNRLTTEPSAGFWRSITREMKQII